MQGISWVMDKREKIARLLYFEFTDYVADSVPDVMWKNMADWLRNKWILKADQILAIMGEPEVEIEE